MFFRVNRNSFCTKTKKQKMNRNNDTTCLHPQTLLHPYTWGCSRALTRGERCRLTSKTVVMMMILYRGVVHSLIIVLVKKSLSAPVTWGERGQLGEWQTVTRGGSNNDQFCGEIIFEWILRETLGYTMSSLRGSENRLISQGRIISAPTHP